VGHCRYVGDCFLFLICIHWRCGFSVSGTMLCTGIIELLVNQFGNLNILGVLSSDFSDYDDEKSKQSTHIMYN